jgi:2-dehydro-3-deoxy-D-arabinonate dehydratase
MLRLYATPAGLIVERDAAFFPVPHALTLDALFAAADPQALLLAALLDTRPAAAGAHDGTVLAPIQSQEVWAAGVTYYRSRTARMAESKDSGGGTFYDKVYAADRPEIFFKATPHRVAAPGGGVRIRSDSKWNVPEPELTLAINSAGKIFGYTLGNDMSSRDIEGENPLYLPQAKVYDQCAALGPCLVVTSTLPTADTVLAIEIRRAGATVFAEATTIGQIKRPLPSLADWLYRDNAFPHGAYLMTGTGIVPPDAFTLQPADEIRITLDPVGTLVNFVR